MSIPSVRAWSTLRGSYGSPSQEHLALVGLLEPADDLHQRRLARAVVAEQPEDLALAQVQVDVAQRGDRAEALGDVLDAQDVVGCRGRRDDVLAGDAVSANARSLS